MKKSSWFIFITIMLITQPVLALRCGHELVSIGDYKADVIEKCGEPDNVESHYERRGYSNNAEVTNYGLFNNKGFPSNRFNYGQQHYRDVEVEIEEWVYDFGNSRLRKVLRFENGKLKEIVSSGKRRRRY
jgi:Protein of unknown function (DUF2845)